MDGFGKYFTELQVEEWADKLRKITAEEEVKSIQESIKQKNIYCSLSEDILYHCLRLNGEDYKSPNFDPVKAENKCRREILFVSECLRRPGRYPGTNPDEINDCSVKNAMDELKEIAKEKMKIDDEFKEWAKKIIKRTLVPIRPIGWDWTWGRDDPVFGRRRGNDSEVPTEKGRKQS